MNATRKTNRSNNQRTIVVEKQITSKINAPSKKKVNRRKPKRQTTQSESFSKTYMAPTAEASVTRTNPARFGGSPLEPIVRKCELVTTVTAPGSAGFSVPYRFRLNIGSSKTFPWASSIALSFEFFRFRKLKFHLITRQPTTTAGSMLMAPDYDAADYSPIDEPTLSQYADAKEAPFWKNFTVECSPAKLNALYKRHPTMSDVRFAATQQDEKTIDPGQLFIGLDVPAGFGAQAIAKLWVEYEVQFFNPQPPELNPNQVGGMSISNVVTNGPNLLNAAPTINAQDTTFLNPAVTLNGVPNLYPTNTLGTFTKDWEGIIENQYAGTGVNATNFNNTNAIMYINRLINGVYQSIPLTNRFNSLFNAASTAGFTSTNVQALAGDVLSWGGGQTGLASLTGLATRFASTGSF